jgi:hypothetical protein
MYFSGGERAKEVMLPDGRMVSVWRKAKPPVEQTAVKFPVIAGAWAHVDLLDCQHEREEEVRKTGREVGNGAGSRNIA